jgi:hypothetical protein
MRLSATTLPTETKIPEPTTAQAAESSLADDILRGVPAIAAYTGEPIRRCRYLLYAGQLPAGQFGRTWVASKAALKARYKQVLAGQAA